MISPELKLEERLNATQNDFVKRERQVMSGKGAEVMFLVMAGAVVFSALGLVKGIEICIYLCKLAWKHLI